MEYATLNNGLKMPMAGIGTFLLSPDEAEASVLAALEDGYRLIDTANGLCQREGRGPCHEEIRPQAGGDLPGDQAVALLLRS